MGNNELSYSCNADFYTSVCYECDSFSLWRQHEKKENRTLFNDNWYYFDYVSGDYQINEGKEDFIGRFVVIGSKLNKENIEKIILIK